VTNVIQERRRDLSSDARRLKESSLARHTVDSPWCDRWRLECIPGS